MLHVSADALHSDWLCVSLFVRMYGGLLQLTKQADTVLMQYPLAFPMNASTAKNDLEIYDRVT